MKLIYRGHTYTCETLSAQPYHKPHALNWRYQAAGEMYGESIVPVSNPQPRALNWRYQMAVGG